MFCSSCGKEIAGSARFCAHCGNNVESSIEPSSYVHIKQKSAPTSTAASVSDINQAALNIAAVTVKSKSVGLAFVLTAFFGPLGMMYSTITGGLLMLVLAALILIGMFSSLGAFVVGFVFYAFYWLICIVWGMVAASRHNSNLLKAAAAGTAYQPPASLMPVLLTIAIAVICLALMFGGNAKKKYEDTAVRNVTEHAPSVEAVARDDTPSPQQAQYWTSIAKPNTKVRKIFDEMLGVELAYFESKVGPAKYAYKETDRVYEIDSCSLFVTVADNKVQALTLGVSDRCNMFLPEYSKSLQQLKFGDFIDSNTTGGVLNGHFSYDSLVVTNLYDPSIHLSFGGKPAQAYIEERITTYEYDIEPVVEAIKKNEGEQAVIEKSFESEKYDTLAASLNRQSPINSYTLALTSLSKSD